MKADLLTIARQFDHQAISVEPLAICKNTVYKVACKTDSFVLRMTNEHHRSIAQLNSELDFQKYLFDHGAAVVKPLQTESGEVCIPIEIERSCFIASAFEFAKGKNWDERKDNSEQVLQKIGATLGKIHRLSKEYSPIKVARRRMWSEQQDLQKSEVFKKHSSELYNKYLCFMREMKSQAITDGTFGLTHGDYLSSNYIIDEESNTVTVIDFDECEYSWYAADLAICIRASLFWTADPTALHEKADEAEMMHYNLLLGYRSENKITEDMIRDLEKYIRIRDFIELASLLSYESDVFDKYPIERILLDMNLDRVLNDKPFLEYSRARIEQLLV